MMQEQFMSKNVGNPVSDPFTKEANSIFPIIFVQCSLEQKFIWFAEGIGAVHELSKMTDHLGNRVHSLEKANETVEVRLTRLKRGRHSTSSDASICSGDNSSLAEGGRSRKSIKRFSGGPSLFSNRCVQAIAFALLMAIAASVMAIACVYVISSTREDVSDSAKEPELPSPVTTRASFIRKTGTSLPHIANLSISTSFPSNNKNRMNNEKENDGKDNKDMAN